MNILTVRDDKSDDSWPAACLWAEGSKVSIDADEYEIRYGRNNDTVRDIWMRSLDARDLLVRYLLRENKRFAPEGARDTAKPLFDRKLFDEDIWRDIPHFQISGKASEELILQKQQLLMSQSQLEGTEREHAEKGILVGGFFTSLFASYPTASKIPLTEEKRRIYSDLVKSIGNQGFTGLSMRMITISLSAECAKANGLIDPDYEPGKANLPERAAARRLNFSFTRRGALRLEGHITFGPGKLPENSDRLIRARTLYEFSIPPQLDFSETEGWIVACKVLDATIEYPDGCRAAFETRGILSMFRRLWFRVLAWLGLSRSLFLIFISRDGHDIDAILPESAFRVARRRSEIAQILSRHKAEPQPGLHTQAHAESNALESNPTQESSILGAIVEHEGKAGVTLETVPDNGLPQLDLTTPTQDRLAAGDAQDTAAGDPIPASIGSVCAQSSSTLFQANMRPLDRAAPISDESDMVQSAPKNWARSSRSY